MKRISQFLKWISVDIHEESEAELASADLTRKLVNKAVVKAAKHW